MELWIEFRCFISNALSLSKVSLKFGFRYRISECEIDSNAPFLCAH